MSELHTMPDHPVFAFCPAYVPPGEPQPIRIVFADAPGYVPTALVAFTVDGTERLCDRLDARLGLIAERGPHSSSDPGSAGITAFIVGAAFASGGRDSTCPCRVRTRLSGTTHPLR